MPDKEIRFKAMGIFLHDGKVLASKGHDSSKNPYDFHRLVGGTIEFGETAKEAFHREILEELGTEIENVKQIDVLENIFEYEDRKGHQIVFLFTADFVNKDLYNQDQIQIIEQDYDGAIAEWVSVEEVVAGKTILYPKFDYKTILLYLTK